MNRKSLNGKRLVVTVSAAFFLVGALCTTSIRADTCIFSTEATAKSSDGPIRRLRRSRQGFRSLECALAGHEETEKHDVDPERY